MNFNIDDIIYKLKVLPLHLQYKTKLTRILIGYPIKALARLVWAVLVGIKSLCRFTKNCIIATLIRIIALVVLLMLWPFHFIYIAFGWGDNIKNSFKLTLFSAWVASILEYTSFHQHGVNFLAYTYQKLPYLIYHIPYESITNPILANIFLFASIGMENLRKVCFSLFYGISHNNIFAFIVLLIFMYNSLSFTEDYTGAHFCGSYATKEFCDKYRRFFDWFFMKNKTLLKEQWY